MGSHRVGHNWSDLAAAARKAVWKRKTLRELKRMQSKSVYDHSPPVTDPKFGSTDCKMWLPHFQSVVWWFQTMIILSVVIKGCVLKLQSYNGRPINGYNTQGNVHEHTHTHTHTHTQRHDFWGEQFILYSLWKSLPRVSHICAGMHHFTHVWTYTQGIRK